MITYQIQSVGSVGGVGNCSAEAFHSDSKMLSKIEVAQVIAKHPWSLYVTFKVLNAIIQGNQHFVPAPTVLCCSSCDDSER